MNIRHTAAIALVGWYFVFPPSIDRLNAPFSEWHRGSTYNSEQECKDAQQEMLMISEGDPNPEHGVRVREGLRAGLCVETTDPRFKSLKPPPWHF
jgi:hypothetical protein